MRRASAISPSITVRLLVGNKLRLEAAQQIAKQLLDIISAGHCLTKDYGLEVIAVTQMFGR